MAYVTGLGLHVGTTRKRKKRKKKKGERGEGEMRWREEEVFIRCDGPGTHGPVRYGRS